MNKIIRGDRLTVQYTRVITLQKKIVQAKPDQKTWFSETADQGDTHKKMSSILGGQ
jgi:hypothetical protein